MSRVILLFGHKLLITVVALGLFGFTIALTFFTLLWLPYRLLVRLLVKLFRPDLDDMVTGQGDVFFTSGTPECPMANMCILGIFEGPIDVEHSLKLAQIRILNYQENGVFIYRKLKQSVTHFMGYAFYRTDEHFDLRNHVRAYDYTEDGLALPNPDHVTQQDLEERLPTLATLPWKANQSNWEILVIDNYFNGGTDTEKHTALLIRMSHGLADGYSLHKLVFRLMQMEEPKFKFKNPVDALDKSFVGRMKLYASFPFKMFYDTAELSLDLLRANSGWACAGIKDIGVSTFNAAMAVDDIKDIKNKMGVGYMAVLLAAVSAALGRLVSGTEKGRKTQKIACLIPLPKLHHPKELTNHFYTGALSLPIAQKASKELVEEIQRKFFKLSKSYAVLGFEMLLHIASHLPRFLFQLAYRIVDTDVILSVYPVPYETYYWEGSKLCGIIVSGATASPNVPFGASIFLSGMRGMQRASITVNKNALPFSNCEDRLKYFDKYVEQEIKSLMKE